MVSSKNIVKHFKPKRWPQKMVTNSDYNQVPVTIVCISDKGYHKKEEFKSIFISSRLEFNHS